MASSFRSLWLFACLFYTLNVLTTGKTTVSRAEFNIGINYGRVANNIPSPTKAVALIKSLKIGKVKLFDADPRVLEALANTALQVVIGLPNEDIPSVASSTVAADEWVHQNVASYFPATQINMISVGNELLSDSSKQEVWYQLVPAMRNIYGSLKKNNFSRSIKVTTSVALNALNISYPPSSGTFRDDIATSVLQPVLSFLSDTSSHFFVNVYPYFAWAANSAEIPLNYALFGAGVTGVDDGEFHYSDLLDAQLDAVVAAMSRLGYPQVRIAISETGWPSFGDEDESGANIPNAADYNRRLVRKMLAYPPLGTPRRPGIFIPTYLFALFNENEKRGPTTERNWGLLYPNGSLVYPIDLTGKLTDADYVSFSSYTPLPLPVNTTSLHPSPTVVNQRSSSVSTSQKQWCIANPNAQLSAVQKALDYACGQIEEMCTAIQVDQSCFQPNSLVSHASYAFNGYWQRMKHAGGTCDFAGVAILTDNNPSQGSCSYSYQP